MPKAQPKPQRSSSREFFLYGLTFITLYIAAFSLGGVLFQLINIYLPDPASRDFFSGDHAHNLLRGFVSSLIVAGPVFAFFLTKVKKEQQADEAVRRSALRKWLTYFTLLAASVVAIVDVSTIVYNFLGGELAIRAFAKNISVLVIALAVIFYFLRDVRETKE